MGIFGRGIAFNNTFFQRGPIRFNCYHRPMPMMPRGPIFGGMSINETFTYKTNFWDALSAGLMAFAQTRMMFGGMGGAGSMGGAAQVTPQGTENAETNNNLKQLRNLFEAKKVNIEETSKGKFTATDENGNIIGKNLSFEDMSDALDKYNKKNSAGNTAGAGAEDVAGDAAGKGNVADAGDVAGDATGKGNVADAGDVAGDAAGKGNAADAGDVAGDATGKANLNKSATSQAKQGGIKGWYRTADNNDGGKYITKHIRPEMTARQVTDIILNNKTNYLSPEDRDKLAKEVERNNPSIFKNGIVKSDADLNKLDIPSIAYIKKHYVDNYNITTKKDTKTATGTYTSKDGQKQTIGETLTNNKTGRMAKKINGQWYYFAKDGMRLNETYIQNNDPDLWNKTHVRTNNTDVKNQTSKQSNGAGSW